MDENKIKNILKIGVVGAISTGIIYTFRTHITYYKICDNDPLFFALINAFGFGGAICHYIKINDIDKTLGGLGLFCVPTWMVSAILGSRLFLFDH